MTQPRPTKTRIGNHKLHPETLMLGYGFDPRLSEGAVKPPVFLASTFVFRTAAEGRDFFDVAAGRKTAEPGSAGLVYSRFNHPNSEIVEDRLAIYEEAEAAAIFSSGMAAISTSLLAFTRPGDVVLHSRPLYGGTDTLVNKTLTPFGVKAQGFDDGVDEAAIAAAADRAVAMGRVAVILIETPSNPLNTLVDIAAVRRVAEQIAARQGGARPKILCDNTLLGPVFQKPLAHGADLSVYSLTKYVAGHSDLVAGSIAGSRADVATVKALRSAIGTQLDPHSAWMIGRSLETLSLRMHRAATSADRVSRFLADHARVARVYRPNFLPEGSPQRALFARQCDSAGATFSFDIEGGEAEAFRFLDALELFKLAVSLGGTESLICHPATTVHSGVPRDVRERLGISDATIRVSIGVEHPDDLIADLAAALSA